MDAISLDSVSLQFEDTRALNSVDLTVAPGEIVGLLGHNGAGKTTLLRVINGLLRPQAGIVRVFGQDPIVDGHETRQRTGVLTEYPALDEYLSPEENLEIYAAIHAVAPELARRRVDGLLEELGLGDKRSLPSRELSAGLKQRVALARALIHDPELLLLDEPTTNMDPVAAKGVRRMVLEAVERRGRTVLLSTHNIAEAEELCDRVAIMREGRVLSLGTPGELRRSLGRALAVRIEVEPEQASAATAQVDGQATVRRLRDDLLEIVDGPPVPDLVALLVSGGVAVHRVEPRDPSLEDLYLHLHGATPSVEIAS